MTAFSIAYRDKRRPWVGLCRVRLLAANARRAAAVARESLAAKGVHPEIVGVREWL